MTIVSRHEEPKASKVTLIEFDSTIHSISITCYIQGLLVPLEESSQRETADSINWRARQKKVEIDRISYSQHKLNQSPTQKIFELNAKQS